VARDPHLGLRPAVRAAPFYLFVTFVLTYTTQQLKLPRGQVLKLHEIAATLGLLTIRWWLSVGPIRRRLVYASALWHRTVRVPLLRAAGHQDGAPVLLAIVLSAVCTTCSTGRRPR